MELCILRHGIAGKRGDPKYPDDRLRPLTPKGRRKLLEISRALGRLKYDFDLVLTSPLVRARQTADIAARELGLERALVETPHLSPGGDHRRLVEEIKRSGAGSVLLVGHEPDLSRLVSRLLTGRDDLDLMLKKGGFCHLEVEEPSFGRCATLLSLMAPAHMCKI